jgi:hypothetical protein
MKPNSNTVQQLVLGADWACAHGDAGGLCDVVRRLAAVAPESLRSALIAIRNLANTPGSDPFAGWASLRPTFVDDLRDDGDRERSGQSC